ncbi:type II toxin-antitoxin system ParD family antitoxin [Sphingomonas psychrotolerans]|uniref:Type II toxin-antitoxin system ParD family antitoxin n=1 Tax=Sphingomonas psychrotolerans TaxID=1327635 RepID=A0ABU3N329_9SPHN|nr:type II toxin-antitoxin system ParD family antitoxin [Sphingomonas psychrotolerans]MDT8758177.1 type II toxin-antitoxin system ParD family antitoxin [Sphingomonas psychrotolerans]
MSTISFHLPDELKDGLEGRIREGAYPSIEEYLHDLIRADLAQEAWEMTPELEALLAEGAASGEDPRSISEIIADGRRRWGA